MEKFSVKREDFELNVSQSLQTLRKEECFFDVTLISDDEQLVSAHKLVLCASSVFFKNILKKSFHSNPCIYLPGVQSSDLTSIIDFIYDGEIQLYQDNLNKFMATAQKLKIEGLVSPPFYFKEEAEVKIDSSNDIKLSNKTSTTQNTDKPSNDPLLDEYVDTKIDVKNRGVKYIRNYDKAISLINQDYSKDEVAKVISDLMFKEDSLWKCKTCGYTSKWEKHMKHHVELHVEGLSIQCLQCDSTFRCRNSLSKHKRRKHK